MAALLYDHPLQDAGVLPAGGDQVTVVVQEGNVGHMTAVSAIHVAWSLERGREQRSFILIFVLIIL